MLHNVSVHIWSRRRNVALVGLEIEDELISLQPTHRSTRESLNSHRNYASICAEHGLPKTYEFSLLNSNLMKLELAKLRRDPSNLDGISAIITILRAGGFQEERYRSWTAGILGSLAGGVIGGAISYSKFHSSTSSQLPSKSALALPVVILGAIGGLFGSLVFTKPKAIMSPEDFVLRVRRAYRSDSTATLQNTTLFITNTELDGFREGDGDLMDKLTAQLTETGYKAVRIVGFQNLVPADKRDLITRRQLMPLLDDNRTVVSGETTRALQQSLLLKIRRYPGNKILYIASRFDSITEDGIPSGSGSLYTRDFILQLKSENIKIVICCLEFKFFMRSYEHLPKAREMLRQQLFLADKIHFLTENDQVYFNQVMDGLCSDPYLQAHDMVRPRRDDKQFNLAHDVEAIGGSVALQRLKSKGVFISGIYTVAPLSDRAIVEYQPPTPATSMQSQVAQLSSATIEQRPVTEDLVIHRLLQRPPNIMCFGLIRGEKGIIEAINLAQALAERRLPNKVYIVGKAMCTSTMLVKNIMKQIFFDAASNAAIGSSMIEKTIKNIISDFIDQGKIVFDKGLVKKLNFERMNELIFKNDSELANDLFKELYRRLSTNPELRKLLTIEICFNVQESEMIIYAMQCRYAIKFDHKGMANNASTIASCLGMYLPTFCSAGMLTGYDFRIPASHSLRVLQTHVATSRYALTVIMPRKQYDIDLTEIRPAPFSPRNIDEICDILARDDNYRERLEQLRQLRYDGVFDIEHVCERLSGSIMLPLNREFNLRVQQSHQLPHYQS